MHGETERKGHPEATIAVTHNLLLLYVVSILSESGFYDPENNVSARREGFYSTILHLLLLYGQEK